MNNIEFRVWCKNKDQWETDNVFLMNNGRLFQQERTRCVPLRPENHIVQFFTGVIDKHRKKVFEGDVLKILEVTDKSSIEYITPVIWEDCAFLVKSGGKDYDTFLSAWSGNPNNTYPLFELEVVGNIFQNPDMLRT